MIPSISPGDPALATRLSRELEGEVLFDPFARGRYATDASIYQIEPIGVAIPRTEGDIVRAVQIAAEAGVPVVPRGGGTSQSGQSIGRALILDTSKYLNRVLAFDAEARTVTVQPGLVLDDLNAYLRPHGCFFPIDVATASRATLGGMAGNNSAGSRSIRYGLMADHVRAIDALLPDGEQLYFGEVPANLADCHDPRNAGATYLELVRAMRAIHEREADEIARRLPPVMRRVAGYNLDRISPTGHNMAHLLVGSEGTLAFFTRLHLSLQPLPTHRVLGVCHFETFQAAADSVQHLVTLRPSAVELVDRTLIDLARANAVFRQTVSRFVRGEPAALLLVEFAGSDHGEQTSRLDQLEALLGDLGFPGAVVRAEDRAFQEEIWGVRKAGLNIVMSMKGDAKPVSFIEDCTVPLEHLAAYTARLTEVFRQYGTSGTWYAHASVGCLHVRPILNLKDPGDVKKMRAIAEQAHEFVRQFKGTHSGEHGDGLVRSEFLEPMLGPRLARAFEDVKAHFDPTGLFNPGKIVAPPRMDDRSLFRYPPGYAATPIETVLDWSEWGGWLGAVEMCNNNGACRKAGPDVMCPSYRATRDEHHVTRGRANTLRLAMTGQLGPDALTSREMYDTLELCIGCKACRRECPTGVDMARMKIEFLHRYRRRHGLPWKERLVAHLPRYAPWASRLPWLFNAPARSRILARWLERAAGLSARRQMPVWRRDKWSGGRAFGGSGREVVLLVDTFNTYFEPENARAAARVLERAGYDVVVPRAHTGRRPLCCGRTYLNTGLVEHAKAEIRRTLDALRPYAEREATIVGLEPSCLLTLRDEFAALFPGEATARVAARARLFEEFLAEEADAGRLELPLRPLDAAGVLVHGHCHQKAFGAVDALQRVLQLIPGLEVQVIQSGCCGMAGSFGYDARHYDLSMQMAALDLLPAVNRVGTGTWIVADGTSCRRQILDGSGREAFHAARVLEAALD